MKCSHNTLAPSMSRYSALRPCRCSMIVSLTQRHGASFITSPTCIVDIPGPQQEFYNHLQRYSASVMLSVLYGKRAPRFETQDICDIFEALHLWESVLATGRTHSSRPVLYISPCILTGALPPIDFLPFLKYMPTPLASWKTLCDKTRHSQRKVFFRLLHETEQHIAQGHENGCFMEQVSMLYTTQQLVLIIAPNLRY
jgi:hypothetical protein